MAKESRLVPLYGVPIHQTIEGGDLDEMKKLEGEAEAHLAEVNEALEKLKGAIAEKEAG